MLPRTIKSPPRTAAWPVPKEIDPAVVKESPVLSEREPLCAAPMAVLIFTFPLAKFDDAPDVSEIEPVGASRMSPV